MLWPVLFAALILLEALREPDMTLGDIVISLEDPLANGRMVVVDLTKDGWLVCECLHVRDPDGSFRRDVYRPLEVELDNFTPAEVTQAGLPARKRR